MNDRDSNDDGELITRVTMAFDAMRVPEAPSESEALQLVERTGVNFPKVNDRKARSSWPRLTRLQRLALGGIGLSTAAGLAIAMLALQSGGQLSAMERLARQLRDVTSYSYVLSSVNTSSAEGGKRTTTYSEQGQMYWQAPNAFRFEDKITKSETPVPTDGPPQVLLEHFVEVVPAGKPGVLIDYKRKTFFREGLPPEESATYPWQPLKMIREGHGEVTGDLGNKEIGGKQARGYLTSFESGDPPRPHLWQVWVDPETDLPLEIGYQVDDGKEPRTTTELRVTDFRWNIELDAGLFDSTVPAGYQELPPPRD